NKVFCGVASATIVLNAFRAGKDSYNIQPDSSVISHSELTYFPQENNWSPFWKRYTQNSVVNVSPKSKINIFGKPLKEGDKPDYGLNLNDESALLKAEGINVRKVHVTSIKNIPA
ncbi:phytochelatin synthase, partial [Escherichia coli]|nr:phytochelatin synthase [Escherichia coli]